MLHNLQYPASVDLANILVVQMLVQLGGKIIVSGSPSDLVFIQSKGVGEDLLAEVALMLEVLSFHLLVVG